MKKITVLLGALALMTGTAQALNLHGIPAKSLALWVAPVEGNASPVLSYRADSPVQPASTMKLVTSWVALERLGPDFTWRTRLVSTAPVVDGTLVGDVYWVGQGDPRFDSDKLRDLLLDLKRRGVKHIAGRLLLDTSAYSSLAIASGFEQDAGESFMAPPDPLLTNLNVAWLHFYRDDNGARVALEPPLNGLAIRNRLQDGGTGSCSDVRAHVRVKVEPALLEVSGKLPRTCDGSQTYLQPMQPREFAAAAFRGVWQQQLGGVGPDAVGEGIASASARELAAVESVPLQQVLLDMNKYSSNPMARSLFLTLGRTASDNVDTVAAANRVVYAVLQQHQISTEGLAVENGSGLSREARLPARLLGEVLRVAARGPYASELAASLPVAGERGTLKKRFAELGPFLRLKTGTLNNVAALAGYWQASDGRRLVIVAIVNDPRAASLKPALDQVVQDVIRQYGDAAESGPAATPSSNVAASG